MKWRPGAPNALFILETEGIGRVSTKYRCHSFCQLEMSLLGGRLTRASKPHRLSTERTPADLEEADVTLIAPKRPTSTLGSIARTGPNRLLSAMAP